MVAPLAIASLSKVYPGSNVAALDGLTLQVAAGEVYGFLGANGAGKSTTIRLLLNFLQPTAGQAAIMGFDCATEPLKVKQHVGYLAGDVALPLKVTGQELLDYLLELQGSHDWHYRAKLEKKFEAELTKPIGTLSKGNRQKIGIIQALMHQPEVLILDEPTSGLDPLMQEVFYDFVREARGRGAAVFMSSHNLSEAQRVCDRVGIIKHGKLIREQTINSASELTKPVFRLRLKTTVEAQKLRHAKELVILQLDGTSVTAQPKTTIQAALGRLGQYEIQEFSTEQANLEDEFMEYYGDQT